MNGGGAGFARSTGPEGEGIRFCREGDVVGGRYRVQRTIARGGMSEVCLVWDLKLRTRRAMKTVGREGADGGRLCRRGLAAEISILRRLRHPGLPGIVDVIEEDDRLSVVMDYIEGETLRDVVRRRGPQDQELVARWGIRLADVLGFLHSRTPPIIYRDMKPGNVMLCPDGRLVLFDFGIAREFKAESGSDTVCLGTPGYAAPEQFGGRGQTDERTDIYGLGMTLYHLVTGRDPSLPPYGAVPIRRIDPGLSSGLEAVIAKCTAGNPADRYRNCAELAAALRDYRRLDAEYLRQEQRRVKVFSAALCAGLALTVSGVLFGVKAGEARRSDYAGALLSAGELAARSVAAGQFDREVVDRCIAAISIDPSREEACLQLLDYCSDLGETQAALSVICPKIASGAAGGPGAGELIYRVAELYFSGNEGDADFRRDYRKAARYFSMLDPKAYPGAGECAKIASALGVFGREVDWAGVAEALRAFAGRCRNKALGTRRVRDLILAADVCAVNRHEFEHIGFDAVGYAGDLLRGAASDAELLGGEGTDVGDLPQKIYDRLSELCLLRPETAEEAAGWSRKLAGSTGDRQLVRKAKIREVTAMTMTEDRELVKSLYDMLIEEYPEDADAYLGYCSWLIEIGDTDFAGRIFETGMEKCELSGGPDYEKIRARLGK